MAELDHLTCEETVRRLDAFVDRELTPREMDLVREHLAMCEGCAKAFIFEENVLKEVRAKLQRISAPTDLLSRVMRAVTAGGEDAQPR